MGGVWIFGQRKPFACSDEEKALSVLRHSVIDSIQYAIVLDHAVAVSAELQNYFFEKPPMFSDRQSTHVLENEIGSL